MAQQKMEIVVTDQVEDLALAADATSLGGVQCLVIFADGIATPDRALMLDKARQALLEANVP